ncbi:MAG TPA: sigma-54-dependent Fis family transcriptional regulator, partial [Deltaproteobacteria bacterium]|nr:sigma-54-dependent Fis family transcriptional regulator [Deltaproteobacteria bacterium]
SLDQLEQQYLKEVMTKHKGRINRAAETAGITTRQLHKLLSKYGIRKEEFKPAYTSSTKN